MIGTGGSIPLQALANWLKEVKRMEQKIRISVVEYLVQEYKAGIRAEERALERQAQVNSKVLTLLTDSEIQEYNRLTEELNKVKE